MTLLFNDYFLWEIKAKQDLCAKSDAELTVRVEHLKWHRNTFRSSAFQYSEGNLDANNSFYFKRKFI